MMAMAVNGKTREKRSRELAEKCNALTMNGMKHSRGSIKKIVVRKNMMAKAEGPRACSPRMATTRAQG